LSKYHRRRNYAGVVLDADSAIARLRAAGCVFAEDEAQLLRAAARTDTELEAMIVERVAGTPLEQILGWAEFCGLRIAVAPGVFVPRQRTEFLVETALVLLHADAIVVDVCCGTGALGAAISARGDIGELHATDIDPVAVDCARRNLAGANVYEGNLFDPLPDRLRGRVDLIVANAPYVPSDAIALMPSEARDHEHRVALDGGGDGLDVQRGVIAAAPGWLAPGAHLLVETSDEQADRTLALMKTAALTARVFTDEERGSTVAIATARP
jgi:release factor glutamine methyltransferase